MFLGSATASSFDMEKAVKRCTATASLALTAAARLLRVPEHAGVRQA